MFFLQDLSSGAWEASREALPRISADYRLVADLATLYSHVEDLRWRLRYKAEIAAFRSIGTEDNRRVDSLIRVMAEEIEKDLKRVRPKVKNESTAPKVQGITHFDAMTGTIHRSGGSRTEQGLRGHRRFDPGTRKTPRFRGVLVVRLAGIEPATLRSGGARSIP